MRAKLRANIILSLPNLLAYGFLDRTCNILCKKPSQLTKTGYFLELVLQLLYTLAEKKELLGASKYLQLTFVECVIDAPVCFRRKGTQLKSEFGKETYLLDKIPFEEQRVIDEFVDYWQTRHEPRDLATHIDKLPSIFGQHRVRSFFRQVYEDLRTDKRGEYMAFSASEFKRFLETTYSQQAQTPAERQAQVEAEAKRQAQAKANAERQAQAKKEREEYERWARADFDALGKEMAKATTRAELVELGRKRADLAPHTGISYVYENHCWNCKGHISSAIHAQCPVCKLYICSSCGSCLCGFLNHGD